MKPLSQMREGHAVVSEEEERFYLAVETIVDKDSPIALDIAAKTTTIVVIECYKPMTAPALQDIARRANVAQLGHQAEIIIDQLCHLVEGLNYKIRFIFTS